MELHRELDVFSAALAAATLLRRGYDLELQAAWALGGLSRGGMTDLAPFLTQNLGTWARPDGTVQLQSP